MSSSESDPQATNGLEERYGSAWKRSAGPRLRLRGFRAWLVGIVAVVTLTLGGYLVYAQFFATPIEGQRVAYTELPGNAMEVTVDVIRDDPARPAVCVVRVRDITGAEGGRKEIYVPPGVGRLNTVVQSIEQPVGADVYGCSYDVPEYLSTPERPTE
ncbi:DUF4307 domain-containing protein [Saccharomonospora viridis]|uniref:DUF4307 domain-containing protein n=1 Tax=Saccharomonospora viridis (strain ATCC 15386 / DSM 43017 / JCM 3036 / CCUG 5913 / NBRC 12207 / NCIMB 9602 / P101) TaxID=471857 RepID=C7MYR4_SACVD|nr:DUF4307 domain-containing protein [Saccharomonospora viridis]ACU98153.1 hypothetical protein Svir_31800 [Saccharomonospora viridis DSM 43017]SFP33902.1 protein of unknown function [Saccharomonospora viridis]